ncbi:unnamed protein product [Diabrotica balteata]|uniref:ANK_REP_REGION domain-containing protein n=1 Tax=Diabrotica balteata TaxID=107213 RepID=A0A9N9SR91_DIABA|nr:unnamed protein product [Diabrotica balteata]
MDNQKYDELSDDSSISLENVEDLISITSNINLTENIPKANVEEDSSTQEEEISIMRSTKARISQMYKQVNKNYRDNFPVCGDASNSNQELSLPQIYKERLLMNQDHCNVFSELWKHVKPVQKKKIDLNDYKFTVNSLYQDIPILNSTMERQTRSQRYIKKNSLGRNIALSNTLNAKTNLLEDTIYECSDENSNQNSLTNIYFNPIYSSLPLQSYHTTNPSQLTLYDRRMIEGHRRLKPKTEKYVIRHIRIRIMLSLRMGKIQKINKNGKIKKKTFFGMRRCKKGFDQNENVTMRVARIHDEQRRIGNGKTSVKIQNMRYGRLNVLRWLLWEAESREDMPALEKVAANNTTLALHYAAARGCLDCVRLLVDSSPELSHTLEPNL